MPNKGRTTGEAAKAIGVSRQTLQTWIATKKIAAPKTVMLANISVRLWTDADIDKARKFKAISKRGPSKRK